MEAVSDLLDELALGFGETARCVQDPPSIEPPLTAGNEQNDGPLPSLEELLRDVGNIQQPQHTVTEVDHRSERADGVIEHPAPNDCEEAPIPGPARDEDMRKESAGNSSLHCRSDGLTSDEQGGPQGGPQGALSTPLSSMPDSEAGTPTFREQANRPISASPPSPPPSPPPPSDAVLSSIPATQAESSDATLQDIGPGPPRAADTAGLNEGGEGAPRSEKVRRTDPIDETDNTDHDQVLAQLRSQPKPVFRLPPSLRDCQHRENARSSSRSSGAGDSQDNPVMLEDDSVIVAETGAFAKATSVEPEVEPAYTLTPQSREEPRTLECLDAVTAFDLPTKPLDRPISPAAPLPHHASRRVLREDDRGAEPVASPPSASTPPFPQQSEARASILEEEEWEIRRIVGKRGVGKGYLFKVRWKDTWLRRNELGNAQRLLQELEAQGPTHRAPKPRRALRPDRSG